MKNKKGLLWLLAIVLAATVYFSWSAYQAHKSSRELMGKFNAIDSSIHLLQRDTLPADTLDRNASQK